MRDLSQFLPDVSFERLMECVKEGPGAPPRFDTPEQLYAEVLEYFQWCIDNPLQEEKVGWYEGEACTHKTDKVRIWTLQGIYSHLAISERTWHKYRDLHKKEGASDIDCQFSGVVRWAYDCIAKQNIEGAAAGLMHASIVSRIQRLAEVQEVQGSAEKPLQFVSSDMDPAQAAEIYRQTVSGLDKKDT